MFSKAVSPSSRMQLTYKDIRQHKEALRLVFVLLVTVVLPQTTQGEEGQFLTYFVSLSINNTTHDFVSLQLHFAKLLTLKIDQIIILA